MRIQIVNFYIELTCDVKMLHPTCISREFYFIPYFKCYLGLQQLIYILLKFIRCVMRRATHCILLITSQMFYCCRAMCDNLVISEPHKCCNVRRFCQFLYDFSAQRLPASLFIPHSSSKSVPEIGSRRNFINMLIFNNFIFNFSLKKSKLSSFSLFSCNGNREISKLFI